MTSTIDARRIAAGLSPAQREVLVWCRPWLRRSEGGTGYAGGRVAASLARRGLMRYAEHIDWWTARGHLSARRGYEPTDLGRAVARVLEEEVTRG